MQFNIDKTKLIYFYLKKSFNLKSKLYLVKLEKLFFSQKISKIFRNLAKF